MALCAYLNDSFQIQQAHHEKALEAFKEAQERSRANDYGEQLVRLKVKTHNHFKTQA